MKFDVLFQDIKLLKIDMHLFETCWQNMKYLLQVLFLYNFKLKKSCSFGKLCLFLLQKRTDMKKKFDNTDNMVNKYNYEYVLGEIACYIAKECNLTPSEAVGVVMNDDCTDAVIEEIQKSDKIDIEALASRYLTEELC